MFDEKEQTGHFGLIVELARGLFWWERGEYGEILLASNKAHWGYSKPLGLYASFFCLGRLVPLCSLDKQDRRQMPAK